MDTHIKINIIIIKQKKNQKSEYNYPNSNFMNTNTNYMRKPGKEYNTNTYSKTNSYKNKNFWKNQEDGNKNGEDITIIKPMFTNSKLENNGNPEGNYVKIDVGGNNSQKNNSNNFNLINKFD